MYRGTSFYKEIMESESNFIIARAARRTGKTMTAIDWGLKQKGRTLFVSLIARDLMASNILVTASIDYENRKKCTRSHIQTHDGRQYFFTSSINTFRGLTVDNIIVDEFGMVSDEWVEFIQTMRQINPNLRVLLIGSSINRGSIGRIIERDEPEAHYIGYSYWDALKDGIFNNDQVNDLIDVYGNKGIRNEFGPWKHPWSAKTNEGYQYLLKKEL